MIGIKHLQAFLTVTDSKSFTRAAEKLKQTQPALSKQVQILENYLGAQLLERNEKDVTLTEAGAIFYPEAKKILESLALAQEQVGKLKGLARGRLVLGASSLPGDYILPRLIGEFRSLHPLIEIELNISHTSQVVKDLKSRSIQLGFLGHRPQESDLEVWPFKDDEIIIIQPPAWKKVKDWQDLQKHQLILREEGSGTRQVVEEFLGSKGLTCEGLRPIELGSTRAIINAVVGEWGFSLVSRLAAADALALGKVAELPMPGMPAKRSLYCAYLADRSFSYAARAFWDFVIESKEKAR